MRKFNLTLLFSLVLIVSNIFPAQAIFGLSKCEKMRKVIGVEESIRRTLSVEYKNQYRIDFYQLNDMSTSSVTYRLIRDSDLKILLTASANQQCFKLGEVAYIRGEIQFAKTEISWMKNHSNGGSVDQMALRSKYIPMLLEISGQKSSKAHR